MRLAFVCADAGVPVFGRKGCSVHVQELVRALLREGVTVELFTVVTGGSPPADLAHVPVHTVPDVLQAARRGEIDPLNNAFAAALSRRGRFDAVYERYALWSSAGVDYAASRGIPSVLEVNAPLVDEHTQHRGAIDMDAALGATMRAFAGASAIAAVSRPLLSYIARLHPAAAARAHVVANGVDPRRFTPEVPPSRPAPHLFTVGFTGSMKPWHGLPVLAEAFATLHGRARASRLLLVGDGPEAAATRTLLATRGAMQAAEWPGAVDPAAVPALLTSMDVAVAPTMPAKDFYFSPLKVFEYMAAARPVVASRIGQLAEVITDGETGLLFDPGDDHSLTDRLDWLRKDRGLRERLGHAARAQVMERHTWQSVARQVLALAGASSQPSTYSAAGT